MSDGAAPVLQVDGAVCVYGARRALDAVDLSVAAGEIYALLGPNGAGKTTFVRAISGRVKPIDGRVRIAGEDPYEHRRTRNALGIAPQQIALHPHLTARENLIVFGELHRVPPREAAARADRFLARVDLTKRAGSRVEALSGGMQRRVNIGAALMHQPQLLALDEPTAGVDPHAREALGDLLLELRREGYAMLLTTHDMEQAASLADRVGILHEGRMLIDGTPESLIERSFGGWKEAVVMAAEEPDATASDALAELGLRPLRGHTVWAGPVDGGYAAAGPLAERLGEAGVRVSSVSLREPTLGSVFFQLVGREIEV